MRDVLDMQQQELAAELEISEAKMSRILNSKLNHESPKESYFLNEIAQIITDKSGIIIQGQDLKNKTYTELENILTGNGNKGARFSKKRLSSAFNLKILILFVVGGIFLVILYSRTWNPRSTLPVKGEIIYPNHNDTINSTLTCKGTILNYKNDAKIWLVVEVPDSLKRIEYWPKKPAFPIKPDANGNWETTIYEDGEMREVNLALYVVSDTVNQAILDWFERGDLIGEYPSFELIRGETRLDRKNNLLVLTNL